MKSYNSCFGGAMLEVAILIALISVVTLASLYSVRQEVYTTTCKTANLDTDPMSDYGLIFVNSRDSACTPAANGGGGQDDGFA